MDMLAESSRRESSLFPKVIFRDHNCGRLSYGTLVPFKAGGSKGRRLSIENNRAVVRHLRKRLDSIRGERITTLKELPEGEELKNEEQDEPHKQMKKNFFSTPGRSHHEAPAGLPNGLVRATSHRVQGAAADYFFSSDSLPTIVVAEHEAEASVFTESDHYSEWSRRASTPGIFVDWKSKSDPDEQSESDDELCNRKDILLLKDQTASRGIRNKKNDEVSTLHYLVSVNADLPTQKQKVRIFVSGGFNVLNERKMCLTRVYSRLSNLVRSYSLPLEIIDLNNEITEITAFDLDHKHISRNHISDALRESAGTAFMAFLSDELLDNISSPAAISMDVMHKIVRVILLEAVACEAALRQIDPGHSSENETASVLTEPPKKVRFADEERISNPRQQTTRTLRRKIRQCQKNQRMLRKHYDFDSNAIPPCFVLKKPKGVKELDKATAKYLVGILQWYAKRLKKDPEAGAWQNDNFQTITENEVLWALQESQNAASNCLFFHRRTRKAENISSKSKDLQLKTKSKVGHDNVREYVISCEVMKKFKEGNCVKLHETDSDYLEKLEFDIYNAVSLQMKRRTNCEDDAVQYPSGSEDVIITEHLRFLQNNCKNFVGRRSILQEIRKYIISEYERVPLAVVGESGCGLSSIISNAASNTETWIRNRSSIPDIRFKRQSREIIVIFRSVGVTSESISSKRLLFNICYQLKNIEELLQKDHNVHHSSEMQELTMGSFQHMAEIFRALLLSVIKYKTIVVIFIDNLNDVHDARGKYSLSWIPKPLPKCVKIVLSFTTGYEGLCPLTNDCIAQSMKEAYMKIYKDKSKVISVPRLSFRETLNPRQGEDSTCVKSLLISLLQNQNRTLTEKQLSLVLRVASESSVPLALKLLAHITKKWRSFTPEKICVDEMRNWGSNVQEFCTKFLSVIGRRHDDRFLRSVACFLTCSRNGLTHQEIVDLVSRDKSFAQSLSDRSTNFISLNVPTVSSKVRRKSIRPDVTKIKPTTSDRCGTSFYINASWYQLLDDLNPFLIQTASDNSLTTKWRQRVFTEAVIAMFMKEHEDRRYYHRIMLAYFSNKPEVCGCGKLHNCGQPLQWTTSSRKTLNCRRLNESIYHAMECDDLDSIKREMIFDIDWLQAKLNATSIESLMDEMYHVIMMKTDDNDVKLLTEALYLSHSALTRDPQQLPSQLVGRLHDTIEKDVPLAPEDPRKYPYTRVLLSQIRRSALHFLMPTTTCLTSGKQVIFDPLHGHGDAMTAVVSCTDGQRIVTASKDSTIKVWDVIERRVLRTIENVGNDISAMCVCMGNYYVATIHKQNHVNVWNLLKRNKVLTVKDYAPDEDISITVAADGQLLAIVSKLSSNVRIWDLDKMSFHKEVCILPERGKCPDLCVARNGRGNNVLIGYKGHSEAIVVNVKKGKQARTLTCDHGRITHVETSREYYIVGCRQRRMEVHELQHFYLFDGINYGLIRILKACADDTVFDIFVNRLGSHLIGLSANPHGVEEVVVWSTESDAHRHMVQSQKRFLGGTCTDLQYCMTACEGESVVKIHNLAAQISKHDHSRTQVRKKIDGIGRIFNMPKHEKYVVAQGTGGSPITIWNVARSRCRGEAVIIERGLLDKNDVVVVKDVLVVILSDRGMVTINERSQQIFETIYVYNLLLRKYERKLHPVRVNICAPNLYHVIGNDKLIAPSSDRTSIMIWSIITGKVLYEIQPDFPPLPTEDKSRKRHTRRKHRNRTISGMAIEHNAFKKRTSWKKCHVTEEEQNQAIFEMIASEDDKTLICSYYSRHLVVFDLESGTHRQTLTDRHSLLQLNKAILTPDGSFLLCTNYDNAAHSSYLTLWDLKEGCVSRRRRDEPKVCSISMTDDGERVAFVTEDNCIKIWDPFRRHSHRSIAGYAGLDVSCLDGEDSQPTTIFVTMRGKQAILFANSLSVWDLESESLLVVFDPDTKFQCCTVALRGQVLVVGRRDSPSITTFRLPTRDGSTILEERDRFGEGAESSDDTDSSYNEEENN